MIVSEKRKVGAILPVLFLVKLTMI